MTLYNKSSSTISQQVPCIVCIELSISNPCYNVLSELHFLEGPLYMSNNTLIFFIIFFIYFLIFFSTQLSHCRQLMKRKVILYLKPSPMCQQVPLTIWALKITSNLLNLIVTYLDIHLGSPDF